MAVYLSYVVGEVEKQVCIYYATSRAWEWQLLGKKTALLREKNTLNLERPMLAG